MSLPAWFMALLFPEKCVLCGHILKKNELDLCRNCMIAQPDCPISMDKYPYLDRWTALWYYQDNVRRSLLKYKFYGRRNYTVSYGRMLAMKLLREDRTDVDVITWIPISEKRKRKRGFDQVELLAEKMTAELQIPAMPLLWKRRDNPQQSRIVGHAQRRANVLGAYEAIHKEEIAGKRILLLDDILTTGATAGECARILLEAGAKEVHFAAVAAARKKNQDRKV
jgi:ComF family protein